jgi:hypothetical protein
MRRVRQKRKPRATKQLRRLAVRTQELTDHIAKEYGKRVLSEAKLDAVRRENVKLTEKLATKLSREGGQVVVSAYPEWGPHGETWMVAARIDPRSIAHSLTYGSTKGDMRVCLDYEAANIGRQVTTALEQLLKQVFEGRQELTLGR